MSWHSSSNDSSGFHKNVVEIVRYFIQYIDYILNKRVYINIIVIILSVGLVSGFFYSINDKDYWGSTFKTINNETLAKIKLIDTTCLEKFDTTIKLAYNNSKNAISKKILHKSPKVGIRNKASIIEKVSKKSFNSIDESKKFRLGELKWKLFSKIQ